MTDESTSLFGVSDSIWSSKVVNESHVSKLEDLFVEDVSTPKQKTASSNFINKNIKCFYLGGWKVLLSLKHPAKIYFKGIVNVECLGGKGEIDGFLFEPDGQELQAFSLNSHGALFISTVSNDEIDLNEHSICKLKSLEIYDEVQTVLSNRDVSPNCLILLTMAKFPYSVKSKIKSLLIPNRIKHDGLSSFAGAEEFVNCILDLPSGYRIDRKIVYNDEFKELTDRILHCAAPKILLCGGKGVGKSTSLRYLVNRLLKKWKEILFIDFDIGQAEFTVPGCISVNLLSKPLLGPNYTHIASSPLKSLFLGFVSADRCFNNYRLGISVLKSFCLNSTNFAELPCVINTMGYVKGCGALLLFDIIKSFGLTHLVQLHSVSDPSLNCARLLTPENVMDSLQSCQQLSYIFEKIPVVTSSHKSPVSSQASRELMTLFYFYLEDHTPKIQELNLSSTNVVFESLILEDESEPIYGEIVAVCSFDYTNGFGDCIGFGQVISYEGRILKLFTPVPLNLLERCRIIRGDLSIKRQFFIDNIDVGIQREKSTSCLLFREGSGTVCPALFSFYN